MATKAEAIDALIDELAGTDVSTSGTIAERINALTAAIHDGTIDVGGGGGGGGAPLVVELEQDGQTGTWSADKTFAEVDAAIAGGTDVVVVSDGIPQMKFLTTIEGDVHLFWATAPELDLYGGDVPITGIRANMAIIADGSVDLVSTTVGGYMRVYFDETGNSVSKSYEEICDAISSGVRVEVFMTDAPNDRAFAYAGMVGSDSVLFERVDFSDSGSAITAIEKEVITIDTDSAGIERFTASLG